MSSEIAIAVNVFNDILALKKAFKSVIPVIDYCIVVDGSYPEYPAPYDNSSDGSVDYIRESLEAAGKPMILITFPSRRTEIEKRNAYVEYADEHLDWEKLWLLWWDADFELAPKEGRTMEDVYREFQALRQHEEKMVKIDLDTANQKPDGSTIWVGFHNLKGIRYRRNHYSIYADLGRGYEIKGAVPQFLLQDSRIIHWHLEKTHDRINQRSHYSSFVSGKYEV
jgi:hypothetical protein